MFKTNLIHIARNILFAALFIVAASFITHRVLSAPHTEEDMKPAPLPTVPKGAEVATFGTGCFWCSEAAYQQVEGVLSATSGYMGGKVDRPTYQQVCEGDTGHAEVIHLVYDPKKCSYETLLKLFWKIHDPTTLNRQGNDRGTQYRSAIFYHTDAQKDAAEKSKKEQDASGHFPSPIVTEITKASTFYPAEKYHQNYYRNNPDAGYCRVVIYPKLKKAGLKTGSDDQK